MKTEEMQKILISILVFMCVITLFHFSRFRADSGIFTYDEYKYIGLAGNVVSSGFSTELIRANLQDPVPIILAFTGDYKLYLKILPYIFIVINLMLIYALAKKAIPSDLHKIYSFIYILLSPLFIFAHITFNIVFISLSLVLSGVLFFIHNKPLPGLIFFLLSIWINPWNFFVISAFLIFAFQRLKETKKGFEFFALCFIIGIFLLLKGFSLPAEAHFLEIGKSYITDLGSAEGIGIFGLITTAIGIILFLRNKESDAMSVWFFLLVVFFSAYDKFFLIYLELFAAYFSGFAIYKIVHGNWDSSILKNYVTLLIFCGLLFSAGSYLNKSYRAGATYSERISAEWLKNNAMSGKEILSYYDYGYLIGSVNASSFTDKDYYLNSRDKNRITESDDIFHSRDIKNISSFLRKNEIGYIWINKAMKDGVVWTKEDEGLLFIMHSSTSFEKIYDYLGVEIWAFLQPSFAAAK